MRIKNGIRYEKNGWIYVSIKGNARERGYAHGCLLAKEIKDVFKMLDFNFMNSFGYSREFFSDVIGELFGPQIKANYPEIYAEMEGIVQGVAVEGNGVGSDISINDIITWNCYVSINSLMGTLPSLIKANPKLNAKYGAQMGDDSDSGTLGHWGEGGGGQKDRCTAFMAVGSYTKDGKIVCAHNSFDNFIDGQYVNVMMDINPSKGAGAGASRAGASRAGASRAGASRAGARILMQTAPGWIHSGTDFYVTSTGFICTETTIGGFNKFILKDPICCRIRHAIQYGTTLEDCAKLLINNNSGDYANSWLIGDIHKNTIMRIELGLQYVNIEIKTDGYFIGYNAPEDPKIRNLECSNTGYYDIRRHQGARRVRLTKLMEEYKGKLNIAIAKDILADHYDVYLNKINPSSRTCCGHYELDDRAFMSDPARPKPYQPRGALDGIVCDTSLAKQMALIGRWGSSCGIPFDKTEFCKQHIQWNDQEPYLKDRPQQPWTEFIVNNNINNNINNKSMRKTKKNNNTHKREKKSKSYKKR